jgi:plasmid stability protein
MKTMTLRGVDDDLAYALDRLARRNGHSVNAEVIGLLREKLGLSKPQFHAVHHDLDHLAGTWTEEDAREFEQAVSDFSRVDDEVWR